jgi:hypothetical protein
MNYRALDHRTFSPAASGLGLVFVFAIFAPTFRSYIGTQGAIIVNGGILILLCLWMVGNGQVIRFLSQQEATAYKIIAGCFCYYFVAIAFATLFLSKRVVVPDLYELHKPLLHLLSFTAAFVFIGTAAHLERVTRLLFWCFAGIVLISLVQIAGVGAIGEMYTKEANVRAGRVTAPFGNPYDYAFVMSFYVYLFALRFVKLRTAGSLVGLLITLALVVLSQSRTNVIVIAIALAVVIPVVLILDRSAAIRRLLIPVELRKYSIIAAIAGGGALLVIGLFGDEVRYLVGGIERLLQEGRQSSLDVRLRQLEVITAMAAQDVWIALFGNGVSKDVMPLVESSYAFFLFRYGVVGFLIVFVLPLLVVLWILIRMLLEVRSDQKYLAMAVLVWFVTLPVASIGNSFTEQPKISFLFYFLMGLGIRYYYLAKHVPDSIPATRETDPITRHLPLAAS